MSRHSFLLCLSAAFLFFSCMEERPAPDTRRNESSDVHASVVSGSDCSDLSGDTLSLNVFTETTEIWTRAFVDQHEITWTDKFYFSMKADTLNKYISDPAGCGSNCYDGVKAYLGLDTVISSISDIQEHLCIILVPYTSGNADTVFPGSYGPFVKVNGETSREFIGFGEAQNYINNWGTHFQAVEEEIAVPVYSFVIPLSTLKFEINKAESQGYDRNVYFMFGYHTIGPNNVLYCVNNSRGYQSYPGYYGYAVHALVLSARTTPSQGMPADFKHNTDFLRPCPRFCGTTSFTLNFPSGN